MKKNCFLIFTLCLVLFSLTGCKKNNLEHKSDFENSYNACLDFKMSSGNSYQYTVLRTSWAGMSWKTVVTVKKGKVTKRHFEWIVPDDWSQDIPAGEKEWIEEGDELNSHRGTGAAEAITLDEIYAKAKNYWLIKRDNAEIFFETKNNGLISKCGFTEDGCADDCFNGINIIQIKKKSE